MRFRRGAGDHRGLAGRMADWQRFCAVCPACFAVYHLQRLQRARCGDAGADPVINVFSLLIGIPLGICSARRAATGRIIRTVLDFMQTMPAFVYLIPATVLFGLGRPPGIFATILFSMPPVVRLTDLGIRRSTLRASKRASPLAARRGSCCGKCSCRRSPRLWPA